MYGKKKKYSAPSESTKQHTHFDRKALSQALSNIDPSQQQQKSKRNEEATKKEPHFDKKTTSQALSSNGSLIILSDSDEHDNMDSIMAEEVGEDSRTKYSEAERAIIIQRATTTNLDRYGCGVLKNLKYYRGFLHFVKCGNMWLKFSEFSTIFLPRKHQEEHQSRVNLSFLEKVPTGWLDMEACEFFIKLMMKTKIGESKNVSVKLLSMRNTQHLFYDLEKFNQLSEKAKQHYNDTTTEYLLMPVLSPGHYFLVVICNKDNTFYYMDSGAGRDAKALMSRFIKRTGREQNMTFMAPDVQSQNDGNSCGVFMLHFVVSILEGLKTGQTDFDMEIIDDKIGKRDEIMQQILELSDNILQYCPKCNKEVQGEFVCYSCKKHIHQICARESVGTIIEGPISEGSTNEGATHKTGGMEKTGGKVICFECSRFLLQDL